MTAQGCGSFEKENKKDKHCKKRINYSCGESQAWVIVLLSETSGLGTVRDE
jgi:hypothetical protein